ncbi:hypothetical protein PAMP_021165 [Pampus punctatissimus]
MVEYKVTVFTADLAGAATFNNVFIKLVGTDGESDNTWLHSWTPSYFPGALDKQPLPLFPEDSWFPAKVEVKSPEGDDYYFPIYRWITDGEVHRFREATG